MASKKSILKLKRRLRRSKRLEKNIRFEQDELYKKQFGEKAMRVLFSNTILEELPNEMLSYILTFLNAKELMSIRCISKRFLKLVDNVSLWSRVSFQNLWPTSPAEKDLFRRGVDASNAECLVKLSLDHLYHYNLTAFAEKSERDVKLNASYAANYFRHLDNTIAPSKPVTWMLIRPPWSTAKPYCLKSAIYRQILDKAQNEDDVTASFNVGKIMTLSESTSQTSLFDEGSDYLRKSSVRGSSHAQYEQLLVKKSTLTDTGSKLQWFRELLDCSSEGNLGASFELCKFLINNEKDNLTSIQTAQHLCKNLFENSLPSGIEKLEQLQPKVNEAMRCILIDWLAEVSYMKYMSQAVLHAAVQFIDKYLRQRNVERPKLQLLGITCLLIAAKCHDDSRQVHILTVREASWLTDQTYQYEDVVMMMGEVIGAFYGNIWSPTMHSYLNVLLTFPEMSSSDVKFMCQYLLDITLQFTCFGSVKPSFLAASVVYLANIILKKGNPWPMRLAEYTGIAIKDIVNTASLIHYKGFICPAMRDDRDLPLESIKTRYMSDDVMNIAQTDIPSEAEMKYLFIASDENLSCTSTSPLCFFVVSDLDDTLNLSTKSIDYYGDCEDDNANSSFDDDDESFCVGRNRVGTSFQSAVEDYSDDETTMDGEGVSFDHVFRLTNQRQDNLTPIFQAASSSNYELRKADAPETSFHFDFYKERDSSEVTVNEKGISVSDILNKKIIKNDTLPSTSKGQERRSKRKCVLASNTDYTGKRNKHSD